MTNLSAFRATKPKDLRAHLATLKTTTDVMASATNLALLTSSARDSAIVLLAWGTNAAMVGAGYVESMVQILEEVNPDLKCFGLTKSGYPKHPLYLSKDIPILSLARCLHKTIG